MDLGNFQPANAASPAAAAYASVAQMEAGAAASAASVARIELLDERCSSSPDHLACKPLNSPHWTAVVALNSWPDS